MDLIKYRKWGESTFLHVSHKDPNLLDVLERDLLALSGGHGEDVHLQGSQSQCGVRLQFRAEAFQDHVVTTLQQNIAQSHVSGPFLRFSGGDSTLHWEVDATLRPDWCGRTGSQLMWHEICLRGSRFSQTQMEKMETQKAEH